MSQVTVVTDVTFSAELAEQVAQIVRPHGAVFINGLKNDNEAELAKADAMYITNLTAERFRAATSLKWIHSPWVGVNRWLAIEEVVNSSVILTNGSGVIAGSVADQVLAFMLGLSRQMPQQWAAQQQKHWSAGADFTKKMDELAGQTVGLVGYGAIGREIGRRAKAFGMSVIATRTNPGTPAEFLDQAFASEDLPQLLAASDWLVVTAPLTPQTDGMLGAAQFAQMKPTAYLINIARGQLVKEAELIEALQEGRIAGAGLDVFEREPLPAESPLWELPNVLITPHTAGIFQKLFPRSVEFFCANLRRYLAGEPLENVVDKQRGY